MKTLDIQQAVGALRDYARTLGQEPIVLTQDGHPLAVLMPVDEDDLESIALGSNPRFLEIIERSRAEYQAGLSLSEAEVRRELGLD
jgi:PHD/YefM family antitoxin component YafN of YafNO toxin-antitoxin module